MSDHKRSRPELINLKADFRGASWVRVNPLPEPPKPEKPPYDPDWDDPALD